MSTRLPVVVLITLCAVVLSALAPRASAASDSAGQSRSHSRALVGPAAATAVPVHQVGGEMNCAASAGTLLWLCSGSQLLAVDVQDPSQPRLLGRSAHLPGILRALVLVADGGTAWLVAGDFVVGLDLANPARPVEIGSVDVQLGLAGALRPVLAVGNDGLWVGSWGRNLVRRVRIGDRPMVSESDDIRIPYSTRPLDLAARGDRLYVLEVVEEPSGRPGDRSASHGAIQVYAVDPAAPPMALHALRLPGEIDTVRGHLAWDGDMLWAQADWIGIWGWQVEGDPQQPLVTGRLAGCGIPQSFTVHEGRAYTTCSTGYGGLIGTMVFDLSLGPEFPLLALAPYEQDDFVFLDPAIAVAQGVLWLGYSAGELRGLDIDERSGPPSLRQVGVLRLVGTVYELSWDKARARLLSSDGDGLVAIDVADLDQPWVGSRLAGGLYIRSLQVDGDRLALVDGGGADVMMNELQLRDLRDPDSAPILLDRQSEHHPLGFSTLDPLRLSGSRLLLAGMDQDNKDRAEFLSLWSWLPGELPYEQTRWPLPGHCVIRALALEGDLAAVYYGPRWRFGSVLSLSVIDLQTGFRRDIDLPPIIAFHGWADLRFAGGHLWLATSTDRPLGRGSAIDLTRIDIRDPLRLHAASFWHETSTAEGPAPVFLVDDPSGDHLILGQRGGKVRVFTMKQNRLASLTLLRSPAPIEDMDISADGDRLFLASGGYGLVTVERPTGGWQRARVR